MKRRKKGKKERKKEKFTRKERERSITTKFSLRKQYENKKMKK